MSGGASRWDANGPRDIGERRDRPAHPLRPRSSPIVRLDEMEARRKVAIQSNERTSTVAKHDPDPTTLGGAAPRHDTR